MINNKDKRNQYALSAILRSGAGHHSPKKYTKKDRYGVRSEIEEGLLEYEVEAQRKIPER